MQNIFKSSVLFVSFSGREKEKRRNIYILQEFPISQTEKRSGLLARLLFPTQILISRRCRTCICQISSLFFNIYLAVDVVHGTVCQNLHPLFSHYSVLFITVFRDKRLYFSIQHSFSSDSSRHLSINERSAAEGSARDDALLVLPSVARLSFLISCLSPMCLSHLASSCLAKRDDWGRVSIFIV